MSSNVNITSQSRFSQRQSQSFPIKLKRTLQDGTSYLRNTVSKNFNICKFSTIAIKIIKFVQIVFGEERAPILNALKLPLKAVNNISGTFKVAEKTHALLLINKKTSGLHIAHKISSLANSLLKTAKFFGTINLIDLGKYTLAIGKLPVFGIVNKLPLGIVVNALQFFVNILGAAEDVMNYRSLGEEILSHNSKIKKWTYRRNDAIATCELFTAKIKSAKLEIKNLRTNVIANKTKIEHLQAKISKCRDFIDPQTIQGVIVLEIQVKNIDIVYLKQARVQHVHSLIYHVAKVMLAAAAVFLFFAGISSLAVVASLVVFNILTYSFGVFKFFWHEAHPIPTEQTSS